MPSLLGYCPIYLEPTKTLEIYKTLTENARHSRHRKALCAGSWPHGEAALIGYGSIPMGIVIHSNIIFHRAIISFWGNCGYPKYKFLTWENEFIKNLFWSATSAQPHTFLLWGNCGYSIYKILTWEKRFIKNLFWSATSAPGVYHGYINSYSSIPDLPSPLEMIPLLQMLLLNI